MNDQKPKYQIRILQNGKHEWAALLLDMTVEPPPATTVMAKGLHELMAKVLVAVTLRDVNAGVSEPVSGVSNGTFDLPTGGESNPPIDSNGMPIILTPNKRIITN